LGLSGVPEANALAGAVVGIGYVGVAELAQGIEEDRVGAGVVDFDVSIEAI